VFPFEGSEWAFRKRSVNGVTGESERDLRIEMGGWLIKGKYGKLEFKTSGGMNAV